jgi:hypothetical protein
VTPRIARQTSGPERHQVRNQVREIVLQVEALDGGRYRVATGPADLARAMEGAFIEVQCAAYARAHGEMYDLDYLTDPVEADPLASARPGTRRGTNLAPVGWGRNQRRPDLHDPASWTKLPDGSWRSPGGFTHRSGSQMVRRVVRRRTEAGLPT